MKCADHIFFTSHGHNYFLTNSNLQMHRNQKHFFWRIHRRFLAFFIVLILLQLIFFEFHSFYPFKVPKFQLQSNSFFEKLRKEDQIFFFALTSKETYQKRVKTAKEIWVNKAEQLPHFSGLFYSSVPGYNGNEFKNIEIDLKYLIYYDSLPFHYHEKVSVDLILRTMSAIEFYIKNSDAGWVVRLCDDTWVNVNQIPTMLKALNQQYDPFVDPVIKGFCVDYHPFIHGGSSYIFSERAAYLYYAERFEIMRTLNLPEDVHFSLFIQKIGLAMEDVTSQYHAGYSFNKKWTNAILEKDYSVLPPCEKIRQRCPKYCKRFLAHFNEIVFVHDHRHNIPLDKLEELYSNPNNYIYWFPFKGFPSVCIKNETYSNDLNWKNGENQTQHNEVQEQMSSYIVQKFINLHKFRRQQKLMKEWNSRAKQQFNKVLREMKIKYNQDFNQTQLEEKFMKEFRITDPEPDYFLYPKDYVSEIDPPINYTKGEWWDYDPTI